MESLTTGPDRPDEGLTRAEALRRAAAASTAVIAGGVLAACGSSDSDSTGSAATPTNSTAAPRKGGTLKLGFIGAGTSESYDPHFGFSSAVTTQMQALVYDYLVNVNADGSVVPALATRIEPNADATELLIELRDGVTWHDGSPFTPEDVIWSLRWAQAPENYSVALVSVIDGDAIRKDGANKVVVPLTRPYARLAPVLSASGLAIIKDGTKTFEQPIGTGAFKLTSFKPGTRSVYEANAEYWNEAPHVDGAELISFADEISLVNALKGGQVHIAGQVTASSARQHEDDDALKIRQSRRLDTCVVSMRIDKAPFTDVKVRQAFKLMMDRQAILDGAYRGFGKVGNDVMGGEYPLFDASLAPREQDIEQAKALLKQAGQEDLRVTLETSDASPGMAQSAELLVQQAEQAGVTIELKKIPASSYYNPGAGFLSRVFAQDSWPAPTLESLWDQALRTDASLNETHWVYPGWDEMLNKAEAEIDEARAAELWREPQRIQYDEGGYLIPVNRADLGMASSKVQNVFDDQRDWIVSPIFNHAWLSE